MGSLFLQYYEFTRTNNSTTRIILIHSFIHSKLSIILIYSSSYYCMILKLILQNDGQRDSNFAADDVYLDYFTQVATTSTLIIGLTCSRSGSVPLSHTN